MVLQIKQSDTRLLIKISMFITCLRNLDFIFITTQCETTHFIEKTSSHDIFFSQTSWGLIVAVQPRKGRLPKVTMWKWKLPLTELYYRHIWWLCNKHEWLRFLSLPQLVVYLAKRSHFMPGGTTAVPTCVPTSTTLVRAGMVIHQHPFLLLV